jgi:hypothetical protein
MGATTHYKGSALGADQYLEVGDYLMSPNRRFTGVLQRDGSFAIYWNPLGMPADWTPEQFEPGSSGCLSATPAFAPTGDYIMYMQSDGNLVICRGHTLKDPVWSTRTNDGKTYSARIVDSGEFQLTAPDLIRWRNYRAVVRRLDGQYWALQSGSGQYYISSKVGIAPAAAPTTTPPSPCASVHYGQVNPTDPAADSAALWEVLNWLADEKNLIAGTVFINKKTGLALGSDGQGRTRMTREVNQFSTWLVEATNEGNYETMRLVADKSLFLNLAGDSYQEGSPVILWSWSGGAKNLLWYIS